MKGHLQEVIVAAAGPSSAGQGSGTVNLYDLNTGSSLFTLKQTLAAKNCSVATQSKDGQGGIVLSAQSDKGLLNVYSYQKVCWLLSNSPSESFPQFVLYARINCIYVLCSLRN